MRKLPLQALNNGKHVYSEKPFVTQLKDGLAILEKAKEKSLTVGNAPDTFLGGRWQTCRKLIDEGIIGRPIGVTAFVGTHGVERHHPNPDFYYHKGGGPLFDLEGLLPDRNGIFVGAHCRGQRYGEVVLFLKG